MLPLVVAILLACSACSPDKGKEQFDTAQFEEKQNNKEHAIQLYEEIVKKYPDSPYAKTAAERLNTLRGRK
jgi:outer membrane protein assembly factor BamD (BamD/ComL family)